MFEREILNSFNSSNIAVIEKETKWSYSQFKTYVYSAKRYFMISGTKKAIILLPQGFFAYAIIWGAYLAGVTFCPVNISNPKERIKFYIDKFQPDTIIYGELKIDFCSSANNVSIQNVFANLKKEVPIDFYVIPESENIAYVIFTSGSTGSPKGVKIKRKALNNFLKWTVSSWGIKSHDICGQFSNLGFDLSIADIFSVILCGATLVPIASKGEKLLPGNMIKKHNITFWHSVPSVVDFIEKANHIDSDMLKSLKKISFCGERLFPKQLEKLFNVIPDLIVFNTYGPTEITIFCTALRLSKDNYKNFSDNTVAIGKPIPGWNVNLENIIDGIGEIVVSGENIAEGYLEDVGGNSFVKTLQGDTINEIYHTGDYAQIINGQMYFVGRRDSQIKYRGHRIDMSEIDFQLREFGCTSSITTYFNSKIISFVMPDNFYENDIRNYLIKKLPEYYMPHYIIFKSTFPLNSSGKIDIKVLLEGVDL